MKRLLLASLSVIAVTTVCHADLAAASANAVPGHYLDLKCTVDTARRVIVLPAVEGGADVAVAMLDRRITTPDTLTTIASQLLLQSDLRGHIEDAAWYLRAPAQETIPAADALMLTQGWTRYDIPAVISGTINDSLPYPLEIGAQLDGVIRSKWRGKPLAGVTANVLAPRMADGASAVTDSLGRFHITGLEWPEDTYFVIGAVNKKGYFEENIYPDFDNFPTIQPLSNAMLYPEDVNEPAFDDRNNYIARLKSSPQGMEVALSEVVVLGRNKKNKDLPAIDRLSYMLVHPGIDSDVASYEDAVANVPGVIVRNDIMMYQNIPVTIWVDGRYIGYTDPAAQAIRGTYSNNMGLPKASGRGLGLSSDKGGGIIGTATSKRSVPRYKGIGTYSANLAAQAVNGGSIRGNSATGLGDTSDGTQIDSQISLSTLEALYPFIDNESVSYVPSHLSMLFRPGIHSITDKNGGILNIKTKNPSQIKRKLPQEFRLITPLGYQPPRQFYTPKYIPDGFNNGLHTATLRWLPSIDLSHSIELPIPPNMTADDVTISAEGLTSNNEIIIVQY